MMMMAERLWMEVHHQAARAKACQLLELEVGGPADEFPANFFVFLFWRETQNSKSKKKRKNKRTTD
jgi:hypothetical protein